MGRILAAFMHVLVLPKWYPGRHDPQLGDFIRKQAQALALRHRVSVVAIIAWSGSGPAQEVASENGLWELRTYYEPSRSSWIPWRRAVNLFRYWNAGRKGIQRAWKESGAPDLTQVQIMVRPALLAWWLRLRHRIPFMISEHSSEFLDGTWTAKSALFKALNHFLFRRASAVTAVGPALADAIRSHGLAARVEIFPNVVAGLDHPLPGPGPAHHFLMVADLVDRTKNVSGALRALADCRRSGTPAEMDIIGDGPDAASLRELSGTLGLEGCVRFLGRKANQEVLRIIARSGTVIVNSNVETFSVVTGEALSLGRPVIATRCGGPVAFITPENGVLIDVRDMQQLAAAMTRMVRDHQRYPPEQVRRTVGDRFGPDAICERGTAILDQALAHAR